MISFANDALICAPLLKAHSEMMTGGVTSFLLRTQKTFRNRYHRHGKSTSFLFDIHFIYFNSKHVPFEKYKR